MENVGHEFLKTHILNSGNTFGSVEISRCRISTFLPLPRIIDEEFGDLSKSASLFSKINDATSSPFLGSFDGLFDSVNEIRSTRTNVGSKYVGTITLIVNSYGQLAFWIADCGDIAKHIDGATSNGWKENFKIGTSDELRKHSAG